MNHHQEVTIVTILEVTQTIGKNIVKKAITQNRVQNQKKKRKNQNKKLNITNTHQRE